jgi:hypothetical protein
VLSPTLQTFRYAELSQLNLPDVSGAAKTASLGTLDLAGRVAQGVDSTIESAASLVTTAVPKGARLATSLFPLPDKLDNAFVGTIDFITQGGMWLAKLTATASIQALLYGAPAWTQAVRSGVAVYGTTAALQHGDSSAEFLARCLGETSLPAKHRETFRTHIELKKRLAALDVNDTKSQSSAHEIEHALSLSTAQLGSSIDLDTVNSAFAGAASFAKQSPETSKHTAERVAVAIIDDVQKFYLRNVGSSAGKVVGSWDLTKDKAISAMRRQETQDAVAKRLTDLFSQDLSPHETAVRINKIAATLNSSFGTYQHGFIGLLGTALGVAWHSGVLLSHAAVAWGYITGGVGYAIRVSTSAIRKGITNALTWGKDKVKDSVDELTSDLKETIKEQVKSSLAQSTDSDKKSSGDEQGAAKLQSSPTTTGNATNGSNDSHPFTDQIVVGAHTHSVPKIVVVPSYGSEAVVRA